MGPIYLTAKLSFVFLLKRLNDKTSGEEVISQPITKINITKNSVHMFQVEVEDSLGKLSGVGSALCQIFGANPQHATN